MDGSNKDQASRADKLIDLAVLALLIVGLIVVLLILQSWVSGTFGPYDITTGRSRLTTGWDWLELLIVPAALGLGALWLNYSQKNTEMTLAEKARNLEREITQERQRQESLEQYLDRMTALLLNHGLRDHIENSAEERIIARARTISVLHRLDAERKTLLFRFLEESGLITPPEPIIELEGVDLAGTSLAKAKLSVAKLNKANLSNADLTEADLKEADLSEASLMGAKLSRANLFGASLPRAIISNADLAGANLVEATLTGVTLSGSNLLGANLSGADLVWAQLVGAEFIKSELSGAYLTGADLTDADFSGANLSAADIYGAVLDGVKLKGAMYSNKTRWPDGFDPIAAGAILVDKQEPMAAADTPE